jgi:hypothetical protein
LAVIPNKLDLLSNRDYERFFVVRKSLLG